MNKKSAKRKLLRKLKKKLARVQRRKQFRRFCYFPSKKVIVTNNDQHMEKLYIIGNGFDLWHELPTSYGKFYEFAKGTLDEIEQYYSFDLHEHEPWHDFENALGKFAWEEFFDFHNEVDVTSEHFKPKDIYGLEDELTEQTDIHVSTIKETFLGWVSQLDMQSAQPKLTFPKKSKFITFNYTSTLQLVYGIEDDRVFHVHGRAGLKDDLIFGHGENVDDSPESEEYEEIAGFMFSDAEREAKYPLIALKKPVDQILVYNSSYFDQLKGVDEIMVIGHSLNNIDLPYFCRIADTAKDAQWKVCCYTDEEKIGHVQALMNCGIKQDNIQVCTYVDL